MRVAWLAYGRLDQPTGGYVYDARMVRGLERRGHHVTALDLAPPGADRQIRRALHGGAIDVVVGDELCHRELATVLRGLPLPRAILVHHLSAWEPLPLRVSAPLLLAELACLCLADLRVATSPFVARRLRLLGLPAEVVVPGADRLPRLRRSPPAGTRLLAVGSIIPRKRLLSLLDALDRLAGDTVTLDVVGEIRDEAYGRAVRSRIARSVYLARAVRLRGALDDEALALAYAEASALVLASSFEGYGMVLTEALSAGLPVLARRAPSVPSVVEDGREALLFDDATLDAVLRAFCATPALRESMARAAADKRADLPTWATSEDRLTDLLCALRARRRRT